ncbi:MAG: dihydroorotate dehydrogenase-like protein [Trueperaceae bacterium]
MIDLRTDYLGLSLAHPLIASSSPWTKDLDGFLRLEAGGASAIVMHSLFEEEVHAEQHAFDHYLSAGADAYVEATGYVPAELPGAAGPETYLHLIQRARSQVSVPIVASLNGVTPGGWTGYAALLQEAGAHAIELNPYQLATDPTVPGAEVEERIVSLVRSVRERIDLPLSVKLSPYWSSPLHLLDRLAEAGADGAVLFNRFYQPDVNLEALEIVPRLALSTPEESRLPVRWIGLAYGRMPLQLALTSGVRDAEGALKGIAAGANVVMLTSEILRRGPGRFAEITAGMRTWLDDQEYASLDQLRGSLSRVGSDDEEAFTRSNYRATLASWRHDPTGVDR